MPATVVEREFGAALPTTFILEHKSRRSAHRSLSGVDANRQPPIFRISPLIRFRSHDSGSWDDPCAAEASSRHVLGPVRLAAPCYSPNRYGSRRLTECRLRPIMRGPGAAGVSFRSGFLTISLRSRNTPWSRRRAGIRRPTRKHPTASRGGLVLARTMARMARES